MKLDYLIVWLVWHEPPCAVFERFSCLGSATRRYSATKRRPLKRRRTPSKARVRGQLLHRQSGRLRSGVFVWPQRDTRRAQRLRCSVQVEMPSQLLHADLADRHRGRGAPRTRYVVQPWCATILQGLHHVAAISRSSRELGYIPRFVTHLREGPRSRRGGGGPRSSVVVGYPRTVRGRPGDIPPMAAGRLRCARRRISGTPERLHGRERGSNDE